LFNLFNNNYLRIFYFLYLLTKDSDDVILKNYYKQYCKTLTSVIKEGKKHMCNKRIINSTNKRKTTWNIVKVEKNRLKGSITTTIYNNQNSPEDFNKYFFSITENILQDVRCTDKRGYNTKKTQTITC